MYQSVYIYIKIQPVRVTETEKTGTFTGKLSGPRGSRTDSPKGNRSNPPTALPGGVDPRHIHETAGQPPPAKGGAGCIAYIGLHRGLHRIPNITRPRRPRHSTQALKDERSLFIIQRIHPENPPRRRSQSVTLSNVTILRVLVTVLVLLVAQGNILLIKISFSAYLQWERQVQVESRTSVEAVGDDVSCMI